MVPIDTLRQAFPAPKVNARMKGAVPLVGRPTFVPLMLTSPFLRTWMAPFVGTVDNPSVGLTSSRQLRMFVLPVALDVTSWVAVVLVTFRPVRLKFTAPIVTVIVPLSVVHGVMRV